MICPHCRTQNESYASKCECCGALLRGSYETMTPLNSSHRMIEKKNKWYFKTSALVVAFLCIGPLALPLLWLNPRFSKKTKIIISAIVIILSYYLGVVVTSSIKSIIQYYQLIF